MTTTGDHATDLTALLSDTLDTILSAVDIPYAAGSDDAKRAEILDIRLREAVSALRCMSMSGYAPQAIAGHAADLRRRLAQWPATGYVTEAEAIAAAVNAR